MDISDIIFQIIAESYPEVPRIEWFQFAKLIKPGVFNNPINVRDLAIHTLLKSQYITCVLSPKYVDYGVTENFRIEMPIKKHCFVKVNEKLKHTVIAQGIFVDIDALYIVNQPATSRFHLNNIDKVLGLIEPTDEKIKELFTLARELSEYRNSPEDVAYLMQKIDKASHITLPAINIDNFTKLIAPSTVADLSINQAKFVRDFFRLKEAVKKIPLFTYYGMLQELSKVPHAIYAFFSNHPKSMNRVNSHIQYHRARRELDQKHDKLLNEELLNVGLLKTSAKQLGIEYDHLTYTRARLLASIDSKLHEGLIARFDLIKSVIASINNNGCEHKQFSIDRLVQRKEQWFGETTDRQILCSHCNLPLCCIHYVGNLRKSVYAIRINNYQVCRYCGEIINELFSDDVANEILDPEFRTLIWARVQAMKNHVKKVGTSFNRVNDARLVDLIATPLYEHYIAIEKMRSLDAHTKGIYAQLYANIYALIGYTAMGYSVRNVNSVAELLNQLRVINSHELSITKYDDNKLKGIISGATYEISNRVRKLQAVEEFNEYAATVSHTQLMQFAITGNLRSNDKVLSSVEVSAFRRANPDEMAFVKQHIPKLPAWFQAYAAWWCGEPYVQTAEMKARYTANLQAEVMRAGYRYTGHYILPYKTHQFFFEGPTDLTAHYGLDGKRLAKSGKIRTGLLAESWEKAVKAGLGYRPSLINEESKKVRLAMRQKTYHILFVERYTQVCPSADTDSILHEFVGKKCKLCNATNIEITTSLDYYAKYESKFLRIKVTPDRTFIGATVKPTPPKPLRQYTAELNQHKDNIAKLSQDMQVSHIRWEQLGNFEGRKASETIEMFSSIKEAPTSNYGITRWMRVNAYLREVFQMTNYAFNFIKNGAMYKVQPVYGYLVANSNIIHLTESTIKTVSSLLDSVYPTSNQTELKSSIDGMISAIAKALLLIRKDDINFGKLVSEYILQLDYFTAKYEKLDFIERASTNDDYSDAQEDYMTINKKIAEDPFYQDFEFDAPEDNIAPRD